jgi:succinate dehydrogenase / fumarate reductase cytochrome b subunit
MAAKHPRPLSPHLSVWRWGPHMLVSILHRVTGSGLAVVGLPLLTWWLVAISGGDESYARFAGLVTHPIGLVVLIGLTWAFFQKTLAGIRHLVMDTGAGFEIERNKTGALATIVGAVLLTGAMWAWLLIGRGA